MEEVLPINYYSELSGILVDTEVIKEFLRKIYQINGFLIKSNLSIDNFINKWLITLFSENFNFMTANLIWDFLFLEGNIVLIKSTITMFLILREKYLSFTEDNLGDFYMILTQDTKNIPWNHKDLIFGLTFRRFEFEKSDLIAERQRFTETTEEYINKLNIKSFEDLKKQKGKNESTKTDKKEIEKCNTKWPFCIMKRQAPKTVINFLIFSEKFSFNDPKKVIENYFFDKVNISKEEDNHSNKINHGKTGSPLSGNMIDLINHSSDKDSIGTAEFTETDKNENEEDFFNIMVERSPHYCNKIKYIQPNEDDK